VPSDLLPDSMLSLILDIDPIRELAPYYQKMTLCELKKEASCAGYDWLVRSVESHTSAASSSHTIAQSKVLPLLAPWDIMGGASDIFSRTPLDPESALRECLGVLLLDSRRLVVSAIRSGFNRRGALLAHSLLVLSLAERRHLVSGDELVRGETFVLKLRPTFFQHEEGQCVRDDVAGSSTMLGTAAAKDEDSPSQKVSKGQIQNMRLLCRLLRSESMQSYLPGLLRFITGCPTFVSTSVQGLRTESDLITVEFSPSVPTCWIPTASTCYSTLRLSAAPYTAEELLRLLIICAENCESFGDV
jgi:hypothetical protein